MCPSRAACIVLHSSREMEMHHGHAARLFVCRRTLRTSLARHRSSPAQNASPLGLAIPSLIGYRACRRSTLRFQDDLIRYNMFTQTLTLLYAPSHSSIMARLKTYLGPMTTEVSRQEARPNRSDTLNMLQPSTRHVFTLWRTMQHRGDFQLSTRIAKSWL